MNKKDIALGVLSVCFLVSCHSHKDAQKHSHDGSSHNHHTESNAQDFFGNYDLENKEFKTKTEVTIKGNKRIMVTNSLPNHETGKFPRKGNPNKISVQNKIYEFPLNPTWIGKPQWVRETGVALNGVKFEPGTAEVIICESGENYKVEAFQDLIDLGLDFNNAHVQPTGAYHYHGIPTSVVNNHQAKDDVIHIGFANDGYPIYYSKTGVYKSSYKTIKGNRKGEDCTYTNPRRTIEIDVVDDHDGTYTSDFEYIKGSGDLDECNGIEIDGKYMYFVTEEFPYISRCLMGKVASDQLKRSERRGNKNTLRNTNHRLGEKRPNPSQIIKHLDVNTDGKISESEAKGPLKQIFSMIDVNKDGFISKQELENSHQ